MKPGWLVVLFFFLVIAGAWSFASADSPPQFPQDATFTTLITTPRAIEGLTGDGVNNLYTGGSGTAPCPIWQINLNSPSLTVVGNVPAAATPLGSCAFSGITFDAAGNLYQADGTAGRIYTFNPNAGSPPNATVFATGVPGTNGLAFDQDGNLWTGDGVTGQGRVWMIASCGSPPCAATEVFRIQPMNNSLSFGGVVPNPGVGRANTTIPPGTAQNLVANGIAFNHEGDMFVIDTARGALWKVQFDRHGNLQSPTGCDTTFTNNTLCLSNVFVAHPILEGGDGIALDDVGNIWVDANERNAVAVVTKDGRVIEIFRNPVNTAGLRNSADPSVGNNHILEFPTSPFISGKIFCTSQSDGDRRDNSPRSAGEVNGVGKISCMDQNLIIQGLPLPVD
jgi:sugar lactone lactonase YvrE